MPTSEKCGVCDSLGRFACDYCDRTGWRWVLTDAEWDAWRAVDLDNTARRRLALAAVPVDRVSSMTDEELLAVKNVGKVTLAKIRRVFPYGQPSVDNAAWTVLA